MGESITVDVRQNVASALAEGRPVIALTSSPFTHTLPPPINMQCIAACMNAAQEFGVVAAIVGICQGRLTVGIEAEELQTMLAHGEPARVTRRDIPWMVVKQLDGGTTVSSSMFIAARAGIRLLVSGAIGAARPLEDADKRGEEISADLVELMHTPVAVVSAGARSVANVAHTAEILETFRVPVIGYGANLFPTFYMRVGKCHPSVRIDFPAEIAAMLRAHWTLDGAGVVIAQPTPAEFALSPDEILPALQVVERQAGQDKRARMHLTPSLMTHLNQLTRGKAIPAYQGILVSNTRLAAQIALEMAMQPSDSVHRAV